MGHNNPLIWAMISVVYVDVLVVVDSVVLSGSSAVDRPHSPCLRVSVSDGQVSN